MSQNLRRNSFPTDPTGPNKTGLFHASFSWKTAYLGQQLLRKWHYYKLGMNNILVTISGSIMHSFIFVTYYYYLSVWFGWYWNKTILGLVFFFNIYCFNILQFYLRHGKSSVGNFIVRTEKQIILLDKYLKVEYFVLPSYLKHL